MVRAPVTDAASFFCGTVCTGGAALSSDYGEHALSRPPARAGTPAGEAAAGGDAGGMPWFAAGLARAQGGFDPMGAWYAYHMGQQALAKGAGQPGAAGFGGGAAGAAPMPGSAAGVCWDASELASC
jgi:hypothetical protein